MAALAWLTADDGLLDGGEAVAEQLMVQEPAAAAPPWLGSFRRLDWLTAEQTPVELLDQPDDWLAALFIGDPPPPVRKRWEQNRFVAGIMAALGQMPQRGDLLERSSPPGFVITRTVRHERYAVTLVCTASDYMRRVVWHWWVDGKYAGRSLAGTRTFRCPPGRTISVFAKPVRYNRSYRGGERDIAPLFGLVELQWVPSTDSVDHYLVQYRIQGAGSWTTARRVAADGRWPYSARLPQLADSTTYEFQVVAVDAAGNQGTALDLGTRVIVRWPDPPDPSISLNLSQQWTFDEN